MIVQDQRGVPLAVGDLGSADRLEAAVLDMLGFQGDPVGKADAALAADPGLVLGHCLKAYAYLFALEPSFRGRAAASIAAGEAVAGQAGRRERLHLAAARAWAGGETGRAVACFEALLAEHPARPAGAHVRAPGRLLQRREERLRSVPERTLAAMTPAMPGYGFVQGMLAFGLEEAGEHAAAEALGREAVAANPRDAWAVHAVAHVLEMQGRDEEGLAWYGEREADWAAEGNFFAVHNAWHLALFHVDRGDADGALAAYDRYLAPGRRSLVLNLCDATALLWRLHLAGDVEAGGERWDVLADAMERRAQLGCHVFNDVHLAFALAGAARLGALEEVVAGLEEHAATDRGDHAPRLRRVGLPAARAALAFARGRYRLACDLLAPALPAADAMTGSRAQREILALTLAEAALRDGQHSLARELLEPRLAAKPASRALARDLRRCGDG
jgi:hypothetical protein